MSPKTRTTKAGENNGTQAGALPSHTISILVANKPGVLSRIALVFARRGFNIDSLVVSPALDGHFSRMTVTSKGELATLDQIIKQVAKLIDVVHAVEHKGPENIEKELALIKIQAAGKTQASILHLVSEFKALTVDLTDNSMIIQITGNTAELDLFIEKLQKFKIIEMVRTGKILMAPGKEPT